MKIKCRNNRGSYSPLVILLPTLVNEFDDDFVSSREWYSIDSEISGYNLTIGREYDVYGILMYGEQTRFLIQDDNNMPGFFPQGIFEIVDNCVPFVWQYYNYLTQQKNLTVIGNSELFDNLCKIFDLVEQIPCAIKNFLSIKETMGKYGLL